MTIALFAFSGAGRSLKTRLSALLEHDGHRIFQNMPDASLAQSTAQTFDAADALIFIGACGIAVRAIAPLLKSKTCDPAVLVIDEKAVWVISLLSGHIGGANALAQKVAALLGAQPVITTATDLNGVFAVDLWAQKSGLVISSMEKAKTVSARLLAGETIPLQSAYPVCGELPAGLRMANSEDDALFGIAITVFTQTGWLRLIPRSVFLGIGCRKDAPQDMIAQIIDEALARAHIDAQSIAGMGTIDIKKDEAGLTALCKARNWSFSVYSAAQLINVAGNFSASAFVEAVTGVDNVCERAAVLASNGGKLLSGKYAKNGVTVAAAEKPPALVF